MKHCTSCHKEFDPRDDGKTCPKCRKARRDRYREKNPPVFKRRVNRAFVKCAIV